MYEGTIALGPRRLQGGRTFTFSRLDRDMRGKPAPSVVIARIAERRGGVVARWELLAAGLSEDQIDRQLASGTLRVVHRGVYALAHRRLDRPALHHAAWLAVGDRSAISHADAAGSWGMRPPSPARCT